MPISKYLAHTDYAPSVSDLPTIIYPNADVHNLRITLNCNLSFHKHNNLSVNHAFINLEV